MHTLRGDGSLNVSILLHAAAFISHLQWTAATFLSVKYNISHPLLTVLTLTTRNCRSLRGARPRSRRAVGAARPKWSVTRARRRRTRARTGRPKLGSCSRRESSNWTDRTPTCGTARSAARTGWGATRGAAGRSRAWRPCAPPPRALRPRLAPPAPPPGAAARSSSSSPSRTTSTDTELVRACPPPTVAPAICANPLTGSSNHSFHSAVAVCSYAIMPSAQLLYSVC